MKLSELEDVHLEQPLNGQSIFFNSQTKAWSNNQFERIL